MNSADKIAYNLKQEKLDGIFIVGSDNFVYLTNISLPYPKDTPDRRAAVLILQDGHAIILVPEEWKHSVLDQGWEDELQAYPDGVPPENFLTAVADMLKGKLAPNARLGTDLNAIPALVYQGLQSRHSQIEWLAVDEMLKNARLVKTEHEVSLLEKASRYAELGVVSALNHLEGMLEPVSFSIQETAERMRVHVGEFGGSATGHVAASQGSDTQHLYVPPNGQIREGNLLRYDLSCDYHGYWAVASRTAYTAKNPPREYLQAYRDNLILKKEAISALITGNLARDVFAAVAAKAGQCSIEFDQDYGVGYGVGVSEREAPYLNAEDDTQLQKGMVVVLDVITFGPERERIRSCDTYLIGDNAPRLLSWYRNYDQLYRIYGSTAVHG